MKENNMPWIIKFGKREHLEQICAGSLRFCSLSYYRNYEEKENEKGRKDILEGATDIIYPEITKSELEFVGLPEEVKHAKQLSLISRQDKYISCFSYFTEADIIEKKIISPSIFENAEWEYVLLFKNPNDLIKKLASVVGETLSSRRVLYYEESTQDKTNLTEFSKPKQFEYQKEFRISFPVPKAYPLGIEKVSENSCFVHYERVEGFICKTAEFQEKVIKQFKGK